MAVEEYQTILIVVERKPFRNRFDRFEEPSPGRGSFLLAQLQICNVAARSAIASKLAIAVKNRFPADLEVADRTIRHGRVVSEVAERSACVQVQIVLLPGFIEFASGKLLSGL